MWDGIGGILKSYLRRVNVRYLTYAENRNGEIGLVENPVLCDGGRILTAKHVYQQLEARFGSEEWAKNAEEKVRAISRFVLHFAPEDEGGIVRHGATAEYERIEDITKSYQYFMRRGGEVLVRRHSCWCLACLHCVMTGPEALSLNYETPGCARGDCDSALYEYANRTCRVRSGPGSDAPNELARKRGHDLAAKLSPGGGDWVLVEAYDEDADGDEVWLGRTVGSPRLGGNACQKQTNEDNVPRRRVAQHSLRQRGLCHRGGVVRALAHRPRPPHLCPRRRCGVRHQLH